MKKAAEPLPREIVVSRTFDAVRPLVFATFAKPGQTYDRLDVYLQTLKSKE